MHLLLISLRVESKERKVGNTGGGLSYLKLELYFLSFLKVQDIKEGQSIDAADDAGQPTLCL